ncbi:MAG: prephenate dehydrogenase, partial [Tumebacillaceae bacterium]
MTIFHKAVVVGCGLIGGSLALVMRERQCVQYLVGVDADPASRQLAVELGVVDFAYSTLAEAVSGADLIILATPVRNALALLRELALLPLMPGCIVTDVGSTKQEVCKAAGDLLPPSVHFIGGHPMAGSEKSGVEAANERLFDNAVFVLSPLEDTQPDALQKMVAMVEQIQAQPLVLEPDLHDRIVAAISHVPHIIAAQLVEQVANLSKHTDRGELYTKLAAGGFRSVTRIASGSANMWRDIVLSNREPIRELMTGWLESTEQILGMLEEDDGKQIHQFFQEAAAWRDALPANLRGAVRAAHELSID